MTLSQILLLVIAIAMLLYVGYAMFNPEKF